MLSWSEKMSIRIAKKIVPKDSPHSVAQVSHGVEIALLQLLNAAVLLIVSAVLGCFWEALVISVIYALYRNFTGGYHFHSVHLCVLIGNGLILLLALAVKYMPELPAAISYFVVLGGFAFAFITNYRHAPAKHVYVQFSADIIRRNRKIITNLLFFGCVMSIVLVYLNYHNIAFAYLAAVLFQSILLHPMTSTVIRRIEQKSQRRVG